jgi:hypothetical protein
MVDEHDGYVYFVRCPLNGYIKIGYSWGDPESRFQMIWIHSPVPVERYAVMVGDETLEFKLHSRFDEHRDHGEWFKPSPELDAFIAERTREWTAEIGKQLRREDKRFPRHASIIPVVIPPVPRQTPEHKPAKRRRSRFGPLQTLLDQLAADKDPLP